jgi:hypothetical protein
MSKVKPIWRKRRAKRRQEAPQPGWDFVGARGILGSVSRETDGYMVKVGDDLAGPYGDLAIARQSCEQRVVAAALLEANVNGLGMMRDG